LPESPAGSGPDLFIIDAPGDGCFARAHLMAQVLIKEGFEVHYALTERPLRYNPKDNNDRFNYHIAPLVTVEGIEYVIDPFHGERSTPGLNTFDGWVNKQQPLGSRKILGNISGFGFDINIPNEKLNPVYKRFNKNSNMGIGEYAENLLKYYKETGDIRYDGRELN